MCVPGPLCTLFEDNEAKIVVPVTALQLPTTANDMDPACQAVGWARLRFTGQPEARIE